MSQRSAGFLNRLWYSLPWLARYPLWRLGEIGGRSATRSRPCHLILVVANHFEPSWSENGGLLDLSRQLPRLERWCRQARQIGDTVHDADGVPFRHTYFFPAEQYHPAILEQLAALQADGCGEVEVHLHHGVQQPDDAANLRRTLVTFRDLLAEEHRCLSRLDGTGPPRYAFVHGNLALANSLGGACCGVDSELQVLADTGCYADFTLPSAPERSQVPRLNAIYRCGRPLGERMPHWSGPELQVGDRPTLPVLFSGPLILSWRRRGGWPRPQLDGGALTAACPPNQVRLERWRSARIGVRGRPDWIFIKLYCHGFFPSDQEVTLGAPMRHFLDEALETGRRSGDYLLHFATAREAFNMAMAAVDGQAGNPHEYRDYRLRLIMRDQAAAGRVRNGEPLAQRPTE